MMADTPTPQPGILISGYYCKPYGYYVHRSTGTRDWLLTYTVAGEGRFQVGEQIYTCLEGDVVVLAPKLPHDYATNTSRHLWKFYWTHFIPHPGWARWLQLPEATPGLYWLTIEDSMRRQRIVQTFERLLRDSHNLGAFQEALALNALGEILLLVAQQHAKNAGRPLDPRVEVVLEHLTERFSESLTVSELARSVSLSPSRLSHLFKEQVGHSIMDLLLTLRLRQAARLLELTSRQVAEIAHDVGFHSAFYFSRQFKARYGMSPTSYRKQTQHPHVAQD